jgi:hypothetical protein
MYMHPSEFIYYPVKETPTEERRNNAARSRGATGAEAEGEEIISSSQQTSITIACITLMPMIYLIGTTVMQWVNG